MHSITISTDSATRDYSVPSSFEEMTGQQLISACRIMLGHADAETISSLTGIENEILSELSPFQLYNITQLFESWNNKDVKISFKEWKLPAIRVGEEEWHGPISNFGNVTWEEFVYADQCMINGLHRAAIAALFRPKRKDYDGETDIRIPFTTYGTTTRFQLLADLDEAVQLAILINYRAMRRAALENAYRQIFPYHDTQPDDDDTSDNSTPEPSSFSWISVHHNLIGDNIQDEDKYLRLNVHTVLHRLNAIIEESRKNRKKI